MVNNASNYDIADVIRALFMLIEKKSRSELVAGLGLGEGTVRSILDLLKDKGLLESTQQGHVLSEKGRRMYKEHLKPRRVKDVTIDNVHKDAYTVGMVVKGFRKEDINFTLRDMAVRNGAYGALIFYYDGKLLLPGVTEHGFDHLVDEFDPEKEDVLVLVSAQNKKDAEKAVLRLAQEMSKEMKKIVSSLD